MSYPILALNNAQNWQLFHSQLYQSQAVVNQGKVKGHVPIPAQLLPILSDRRILVAGCNSQVAKPNWRVGGWLIPTIEWGGGETLEANLGSYSIPLHAARLILVPQFAQSYKLRFQPPKWFTEVSLFVYQYIGTEADSTELMIQALQAQVSNL